MVQDHPEPEKDFSSNFVQKPDPFMEVSDDLLQIKKDIHKSNKPEVHELMQTKEKFATNGQSEA